MLSKSSLSINSKVFVSKTQTEPNSNKMSKLSFDSLPTKRQDFTGKDRMDSSENYFPRQKSFAQRSEEMSPTGSNTSFSTTETFNLEGESGYSTDSSDGSSKCVSPWKNSCNGVNVSNGQNNYRNSDQKYLIRNVFASAFVPCASSVQPGTASSLQTMSEERANCDGNEKKRRRRAGRKHRRKNSKNSDQSLNSDKDAIKYKTELCKNWVEKGKCSYSVRCRFAHGEHELVKACTPKEQEDYKCKPCSAFHNKSYCPYGVRCAFIHEDRKLSSLPQSFFGKNLMLNEEAKALVSRKRLPVFASLCKE